MPRLCQAALRSPRSRWLARFACLLACFACAHAAAQPGPFVPVASDLLLQGRPAEGTLILHSGYRNSEVLDADTLVFLGASESSPYGDVLSMSVGVREPHGYAEGRLGRMLLATGAVRPVHLDGGTLTARTPFGASLELFGGMPVVRELGARSFDWLAGARLSQRLLGERLGAGVSYLQRRDAGELAQHELGADLSLRPAPWLALSGLGSWDALSQGLAEARLNAVAYAPRGQLELYASRRIAARLLPATSLFSVISRAPSTELGAAARYRLFPRLSLAPYGALEGLEAQWGYRVALRSALSLTAAEGGVLSFELSRRKLAREGYSAGLLQIELPSSARVLAHASLELVAADHPAARGALWPWARVGASYPLSEAWLLSAALGWKASPEYRSELYALLRLSLRTQIPLLGLAQVGQP